MPLCSGLYCLPCLSAPLPTLHAKHCPFSQPLLTPGRILRRGLIIVVPLGGGTDVWLWGTNMRFRLKCVRGVYKWVLVTVWCQPGRFLSWVYFSSISPTHRHRNKRVLRKGASVCGIHACKPSPGEKEQEVWRF